MVNQAAVALHRAQLLSSERENRATAEREQRRFQAIFEHSLDGIVLFDDDLQIVDGNPAACAILGRPHAELVGLKFPRLWTRRDSEEPPVWISFGPPAPSPMPSARCDSPEGSRGWSSSAPPPTSFQAST